MTPLRTLGAVLCVIGGAISCNSGGAAGAGASGVGGRSVGDSAAGAAAVSGRGGGAGVGSGGSAASSGRVGSATAGSGVAGVSGANAAGGAGAAGSPAAGGGGASGAGEGGGGGGTGKPAATGCSNPSLVFCDDFEKQQSADAPRPPWSIVKNGMGSLSSDTQTAAHSGKASIKVSSDGGYQTFFALTGAPVFPHTGALYVRLFIRLQVAMSSGHNTYYKAGASGMPSSDHETRMGVMNGMLMINQPAGDRGFLSNEKYYQDGNKPGVVFRPMQWECVETLFDPTNKTIDVWVNGTEVPDLHRTDWEQDPIGALHFGFEKYAGPDAVLWYDDIAVSTQPIGCD